MIIRWICEKCSKKWLYPVEKCIYCRGPVTKQKSKRARIIGMTTVNIASPMHPIIPYNVLLLEDEFGNRVPRKTMRKHRLGETYEIMQASTEGAVILTKVKYDLGEALGHALSLLHSSPVQAGDRILIKPSIIEPAYPYQSVTTNPKLVELLILWLKAKGVTDIVVGERAFLGNDTMAAASKAGIFDVCRKHDVAFIDLGATEYVEKKFGGFAFQVAKDAAERKIINVPVMKTHSQLGIAGALENMIRMASPETQKMMYREGIEAALPNLVKAIGQFLTIGDATNGLQGNGPTSLGEPAFLNLLLVSRDPVALDSVFCELGMFQKPKHIAEASRAGIGESDPGKIENVDYDVDAVKYRLKAPVAGESAHPNITIVDGKADPFIFSTSLRLSQKLVGVSGQNLTLAIGPHLTAEMLDGKQRVVLYGKDAIRRGEEIGVEPVAEIPEDIPEVEKLVYVKSILENPGKKSLGIADAFKAKLASFSKGRG